MLLLLLLFRFATLRSSLSHFRQGVQHFRSTCRHSLFICHAHRPAHPPCSAPALSICLARAISACLIHNLRGRSERAQRSALGDLCTQVRSQCATSPHPPAPPPSFCCPRLSTCEREPSESCSFNFHEIIICFVIRASLAGRQQRLRGGAERGAEQKQREEQQ